MGNLCGGGDPTTKKIDAQLKKEGKIYSTREHRLLLLGPGESGKSTIFKQVDLINKHHWPEEFRLTYVAVIHSNTIEGIKILLDQSEKLEGDIDTRLQADAKEVLEAKMDTTINSNLAGKISSLWRDPHVQKTFEQRATYQLGDSVQYYLDNRLGEMGEPNYVPTEEDIVRSRTRTSGIIEKSVPVSKHVTFKMFDVGGQRRERRKWIHMFEDVKAVLFVAAISEYDQVLREDGEKNRLMEAIDLFEQICQQELFEDTTFIVFLNKNDLFEAKFAKQKSPLSELFKDYEGGYDKIAAINFIIAKFLEKPLDETKEIVFHVTDATNKDNIQVVFEAVQDKVLTENLHTANIF